MKKAQANKSWLKRIGWFIQRNMVRVAGIGSSLTSRYCLIHGVLVRSVHDIRVYLDIQKLNPCTGRFESKITLMDKVLWGWIEVYYVSKKEFEQEVSRQIRQSSLSGPGQNLDK